MYQNVEHAWGRMNNIPIVNVKIIKWIYVELLIIYSGWSYLVLIKIVKEFIRLKNVCNLVENCLATIDKTIGQYAFEYHYAV